MMVATIIDGVSFRLSPLKNANGVVGEYAFYYRHVMSLSPLKIQIRVVGEYPIVKSNNYTRISS
jgi:hypothetical protein